MVHLWIRFYGSLFGCRLLFQIFCMFSSRSSRSRYPYHLGRKCLRCSIAFSLFHLFFVWYLGSSHFMSRKFLISLMHYLNGWTNYFSVFSWRGFYWRMINFYYSSELGICSLILISRFGASRFLIFSFSR